MKLGNIDRNFRKEKSLGRVGGGGPGGFGQIRQAARGGADQGGPLIEVLVAQIQPTIAAGSGYSGRNWRGKGSVDRHGHDRTMKEQDAKLKPLP